MMLKATRCFDYLDNGPPINVFARIEMLRTDQGGRNSPFGASYRPNHNFEGEDNRSFYIGQVRVPDGDLVYSGESRDLWVEFLHGPGLEENLKPGRKWRIQEGPKLVAIAEVLKVEVLG